MEDINIVLSLYRELQENLDELLKPVREIEPGFGKNLVALLKRPSIPGVTSEMSEKILRAAQTIRNLEKNENADVYALLEERKRTMAEFTPDHRPLVIYAIYRADIHMPLPKLTPQAGHAFDEAHDNGKLVRPYITSQYKGSGHGTKVLMYAKNLRQLLRAYHDAQDAEVPVTLIIDRGHVYPPDFDGNPIVTAVGIGPVYKDEVEHITKRYTLAK
jgi:PTH2 family peptidyl-tRNA hydrolase